MPEKSSHSVRSAVSRVVRDFKAGDGNDSTIKDVLESFSCVCVRQMGYLSLLDPEDLEIPCLVSNIESHRLCFALIFFLKSLQRVLAAMVGGAGNSYLLVDRTPFYSCAAPENATMSEVAGVSMAAGTVFSASQADGSGGTMFQ